jgi:hypothetical protein
MGVYALNGEAIYEVKKGLVLRIDLQKEKLRSMTPATFAQAITFLTFSSGVTCCKSGPQYKLH